MAISVVRRPRRSYARRGRVTFSRTPAAAASQTLTLGSIGTGTGVITGPSFAQTGLAPAPDWATRITAGVYGRDGAFKVALPDSFNRRWQKVHSDTGLGSLELQNDDSALGSFSYGDLVYFSLDSAARFAALVEDINRVVLTANEEVDEVTTVSGRSRLAILEEAVVAPNVNGIQDNRLFNYASADLDDAGWGYAVQGDQGRVASGQRQGAPNGWPDDSAWWIWDRYSPTTPGAGVPNGDVYFRRIFTVVSTGAYRLFTAADDIEDVWIDGVRLINRAGSWSTTKYADVDLNAGSHLIAIKGTNSYFYDSPAGVIVTIKVLNPDGSSGATILNSDSSWKCLGYPASPPGFTPGRVLRLLIAEAQARGSLAGVTTTFNDNSDSGGATWPVTGDIAVKVGQDLLSVTRQLHETYFDVRMHVGSFTLDAFQTLAGTASTTLAVGTNLTELIYEGKV